MEGPADPSGRVDPLSPVDVDVPAKHQHTDAASCSQFVPSPEWNDAFKTQCTTGLYKSLKIYAVRRARGVAKTGAFVDDYYASELVQDALADTTLGTLSWDPAAKSLEAHIRDAIATRAYHDRRHARRFRHESVDMLASDAPRAMMAEIEASLQSRTDNEDAELARQAAEAIANLRKLATQDREVVLLLDAFRQGSTSRQEILRVTGLSAKAYHNARGRLGRLVAQSPEDGAHRSQGLAKQQKP
jgi:hypothetical protein